LAILFIICIPVTCQYNNPQGHVISCIILKFLYGKLPKDTAPQVYYYIVEIPDSRSHFQAFCESQGNALPTHIGIKQLSALSNICKLISEGNITFYLATRH